MFQEFVKGKLTKFNIGDPDRPGNARYAGFHMNYGKERRKWFLNWIKEKGKLPVNCPGGISRDDPDLKKLKKKGIIKFERISVGFLCSTRVMADKRITYAVLKNWKEF